MENKQVLDIHEEELQAILKNGEVIIDEVEEEQGDDVITFDVDLIAAHEEYSQPDTEEYDLGVAEASRYVGQFHSLINAGLNSESAIVIMSWIREAKLNKEALDSQVEMARIADIKMKHESL